MDEEQLISLVEKCPELYDHGAPKYNDEQHRNSIWQQIGNAINETPAECKDKWKKIRDNYRKALNLRISKKEQGIDNMKPIRYGRELSFLNPFIHMIERKPAERDRDRDSARAATSEDDQSSRASPLYAPDSPAPAPAAAAATNGTTRPKKRIKTEETPTSTHFLFQPCSDNLNLDTDTVVDFFKYLGETVKHFPLDLQVRVKSDVFNIVNQAEAECVQRMNVPI